MYYKVVQQRIYGVVEFLIHDLLQISCWVYL